MPKTENIEWEIKDGKCECRLLSKCEILIPMAWRIDPQGFMEIAAGHGVDKIKKTDMTSSERNIALMLMRDLEYDGRRYRDKKDEGSFNQVRNRLIKTLKPIYYDSYEVVDNIFCETAIELKDLMDKIDKEIKG